MKKEYKEKIETSFEAIITLLETLMKSSYDSGYDKGWDDCSQASDCSEGLCDKTCKKCKEAEEELEL